VEGRGNWEGKAGGRVGKGGEGKVLGERDGRGFMICFRAKFGTVAVVEICRIEHRR